MKYFTDCYDVHQQNKQLPGVYPIQVDPQLPQTTVKVACLASGWTVFQSRGQYGNPADYFFKGWSDYETGFGTPGKILHRYIQCMSYIGDENVQKL